MGQQKTFYRVTARLQEWHRRFLMCRVLQAWKLFHVHQRYRSSLDGIVSRMHDLNLRKRLFQKWRVFAPQSAVLRRVFSRCLSAWEERWSRPVYMRQYELLKEVFTQWSVVPKRPRSLVHRPCRKFHTRRSEARHRQRALLSACDAFRRSTLIIHAFRFCLMCSFLLIYSRLWTSS